MFVPWEMRVSEDEVAAAVAGATSWRAVLDALGYSYHPKNIATTRTWAERRGISTAHLSDYRGGSRALARCSDAEIEEAVAGSFSWAETLRRLGYCHSGANWKTLQKRVAELGVSTDHFDRYATTRRRGIARRIPLEEILVKGSSYSRSSLKQRLYDAGLRERRCELCGQDESWNGQQISLILDHVNGVRDDNRLGNLRIICPNCAAGLDTHCGRKNRIEIEPRPCLRCSADFRPKYSHQRYCSQYCALRRSRTPAVRRLAARKVDRPPRDRLLHEIDVLGYSAVGRKYGVSDNAIRKWVRQYEREAAVAEGRDPEVIEIPRRTWPNRRRDQDEAA